MKKNIRGYIFSRNFFEERVPQHIQNLVIRDFCDRNNFHYLLSATEYAMENCFLILNQVLNNLHEIDGIALYSLFQLPQNFEERKLIYSKVLSQGKSLHFSVEGLSIETEFDIDRIETIWKIKQVLPYINNVQKRAINASGKLRNFVTPLHTQTKRDYLARMNDDKVYCMSIAKKYDKEYWDGERRFGYGGYKYIPGRWKPVAQQLIDTYKLKANSKVLDIGCGKGALLYEMLLLEPNLHVVGFDISEYALEFVPEEVKKNVFKFDAKSKKYPFQDKEFDLVVSLGTLHNLDYSSLKNSLQEIERISNRSYVMVESYRNNLELFNLQCWALTCETFLSKDDWIEYFSDVGYTGDYEFIYFE